MACFWFGLCWFADIMLAIRFIGWKLANLDKDRQRTRWMDLTGESSCCFSAPVDRFTHGFYCMVIGAAPTPVCLSIYLLLLYLLCHQTEASLSFRFICTVKRGHFIIIDFGWCSNLVPIFPPGCGQTIKQQPGAATRGSPAAGPNTMTHWCG